MLDKNRKTIGFYLNKDKTTSGQRFYLHLCEILSQKLGENTTKPHVVLFNISAPLVELVKCKLRRQKIIVRVDGVYFDRLSESFIAEFNPILQKILSLGLRFPRWHDCFAALANFLGQNYTGFLRIWLADKVVFQSKFSMIAHKNSFKKKKSHAIICNGAKYIGQKKIKKTDNTPIKLVTIYDEWRPSKQIHKIVAFVQWANEVKNAPIQLTILGYTGKLPQCIPNSVKTTIETVPYIITLPRFTGLEGDIQQKLYESDIYITFTYRDACPNVVIEAMAHGLPVVGIESGGIPDIVGDAGILLQQDDFATGYYSDHRFACNFPTIDFEKVLESIQIIMLHYSLYQERVRERFQQHLDIEVVAERYIDALQAVLE